MDTLELLENIGDKLTGVTAPQPSDQLSGHAGGLVFETKAHEKLVEAAPGRAFRHFEALNEVLTRAAAKDIEPSEAYLGAPALRFLVARGASAMKKWTPNNHFEEKQNDTAESILFSNEKLLFKSAHVDLIDIKSQNILKSSQPPNIISANKICEVAKLVLEYDSEPNFDILYLGVKYAPITQFGAKLLKAKAWRAFSLFKIEPAALYINWAAALQIQFEPFGVDQTFSGTRREWLEIFLRDCYAPSLEKRIAKQQRKLDGIRRLIQP